MCFYLVRNDDLEFNLKTQPLVLAVHNASTNGDDYEVVGKANVPLQALLDGVSIHKSSHDLVNYDTNTAAGSIVASIRWNQPLRVPAVLGNSIECHMRQSLRIKSLI